MSQEEIINFNGQLETNLENQGWKLVNNSWFKPSYEYLMVTNDTNGFKSTTRMTSVSFDQVSVDVSSGGIFKVKSNNPAKYLYKSHPNGREQEGKCLLYERQL